MINRVYKFGCRKPVEEHLALQLLGQASNYKEDLRRIYNKYKRLSREVYLANRESAHVAVFEKFKAEQDDIAHVQAYTKSIEPDINEMRNAEIREARRNRGHLLDAGTYWLIEAEVLAAAKASGINLIKQKPFDWTGRIGAAIQSVDKFSADNFTHKRAILTVNHDSPNYHLLTLKIGDLEDNRTLTFPIYLHRDFPTNAIVKQVAVQRIRFGHRFRWEALITVAFEEQARDLTAEGVVGIDIGWRKEPNGIRVATFNSNNETGCLITDTLSKFEYSDAVKSIRDSIFNDVKNYAANSNLPGTDHIHLWKDKARLARLATKTNDFGLIWWRERDKHLEDIEAGVRTESMRRRLYQYRQFANDLAKKYKYVALEDMPMSDWVGEGDTHALERQRSSAALYVLQLVIAQRFGEQRTNWIPPEYTSMICSDCGFCRATSVGPKAEWSCENCGVVHHQDENAATILRQQCEQWIAENNTVATRNRKPKKSKRKKQAQLAA